MNNPNRKYAREPYQRGTKNLSQKNQIILFPSQLIKIKSKIPKLKFIFYPSFSQNLINKNPIIGLYLFPNKRKPHHNQSKTISKNSKFLIFTPFLAPKQKTNTHTHTDRESNTLVQSLKTF